MKPLLMFRGRGLGAVFKKTANLTKHLAHSAGAYLAAGGGGCSGVTITIGTDGTNYGYVTGSYGEISESETPLGTPHHSIYVTPSNVLTLKFGDAGNEKPAGAGDTATIKISGYGNVLVGWDTDNLWYSGTAPGLFDLWSTEEETCVSSTHDMIQPFYAATHYENALLVQYIGIGNPSTAHATSIWALDHEGVAREFPANEPVWKGARCIGDPVTECYADDGTGALLDPQPYLVATSDVGDMNLVMRTTGVDETITLPLTGTNNLLIDWGDGSNIETVTTASPSHVYSVVGDYDIHIGGTATKFYFNNAGDKDKLIKVLNLGDVSWSELLSAFYGCSNIIEFNNGTGDVSSVTIFYYMMCNWTSLTTPPVFADWDVSSGTNFTSMMRNWNSITTPPVFPDWDVSSGTDFTSMMHNWTSLTTPPVFADWDVSSGTNFSYMMHNWSSLTTPPIFSDWDVSSGISFAYMMYNWTAAGAVDIGIDNWVITSATDMTDFLSGTELTTACYDRTLIAWDGLTLDAGLTEIHFGNSKYTAGGAAEAARTSLVGKGITIIDGGAA